MYSAQNVLARDAFARVGKRVSPERTFRSSCCLVGSLRCRLLARSILVGPSSAVCPPAFVFVWRLRGPLESGGGEATVRHDGSVGGWRTLRSHVATERAYAQHHTHSLALAQYLDRFLPLSLSARSDLTQVAQYVSRVPWTAPPADLLQTDRPAFDTEPGRSAIGLDIGSHGRWRV